MRLRQVHSVLASRVAGLSPSKPDTGSGVGPSYALVPQKAQARGGDISSKTSSPKKPHLPKGSQPIQATRSSSRQGLKLGSVSKTLSLTTKQLPQRSAHAGSAPSTCPQLPVPHSSPEDQGGQLPFLKSPS